MTTVARAAVTDPGSTVDGAASKQGARSISYVGTVRDVADLRAAGVGSSGSWFAQFDTSSPITGAPTSANAQDRLPSWVGAFNHSTGPSDLGCSEPAALDRGCLPTYNFRTFSQDGPARSSGGYPTWPIVRLPTGDCGRAGAIVDPQTAGGNKNNTVNRIQLQDGVPETFLIGVVTDTTDHAYDAHAVEIRGNVGLIDQEQDVAHTQVETSSVPPADALAANGRPDVHLFRIDHFRSGDYLKVRLRGSDTAAASFAGLVFDDARAARGAQTGGPRLINSCHGPA